MGKKSKKQKGRISLREVEMNFKQGNYQVANKKLTNAVVKSGEEDKYFSLKTQITQQLSLQYFENHEYERVTKYLIPTLGGMSKRYPSVDFSSFFTMIGVSYLYQQKYEEAQKHLQPLSEKNSTAGFYFLLALLYTPENNLSTWEIFAQNYNIIFQSLPENRQRYLETIFFLQKNNSELPDEKRVSITGFLENIKQESRSNLFNLQVLKNIFEAEKNDLESLGVKNEKVKPLYKLISDIPLSNPSELTYLQTISSLEHKTKQIQGSGDFHQTISKLEQLAEENKLIPFRDIDKYVNSVPEEYQAYIVYNQIAMIANKGLEAAVDDNNIMSLVNKYARLMLSLPEGGILYFSLASFYPDGFNGRNLISNLELYLSNVGDTLLPIQMSNLSWLLYETFNNVDHNQRDAVRFRKSLIEIIVKYPSLIGLKWWFLLNSIFSPNVSPPKETLDIFSFDLSKHTQVTMGKRFHEMLNGVSPKAMGGMLDDIFRNMMPVELGLKMIFSEVITKFGKAFSMITKEHEIHPQSKILLDCYNITFSEISNNQKIFSDNPQLIDSLEKEFRVALKLMKEDQPDSQYLKDFENRNLESEINEIMDMVLSASESKYFPKKIDKRVAALGETNFITQFLKRLDDIHYDPDLEKGTVKLLLHLHDKMRPPTESPLFFFGKEIKKLVATHNCGCPMDFLVGITNKLGKSSTGKKLREQKPLYPFLLGYGEDLKSRKLHKPVRDFQTWLATN